MNAPLNHPDFADEADTPSRVLIVDDDEHNLLALKTVIEDVADVIAVSSGEQALRQLLKYEFAAILLDVFMPIMDGYETARLIRQREMSKGTPIIFLSAVNKEFEHLNRGYAMGAVDYVFKPVEPLILRSKVAVFVDLHKKKREIERIALQERRLREENQHVHRELAQAQKMDAVGKLTGGIAHDFNNLLAAVLGGLDLIQRQIPLNPGQQEIVDLTTRSARQGADLVKRLLAFSRRQELKAATVSCERLAASLNGLLSHTLGGLVQVEWTIEDGAWPILADENQLELALVNLILNARDAMQEGGRIEVIAENRVIDAHSSLAAGDYVSLRVIDAGSGIPGEDIDRVFEPFYTTKEVGKGTGLGLSMVYGFATQSGGAIEVRSRIGVGTTFELLLPRAERLETPESARTTVRNDADSSVHVLLVDDHPAVREMAEAMLTDLGHSVTAVDHPEPALTLFKQNAAQFGAIITDYAMPGMSGVELIRQSRAVRPDVPAIVITGYAETIGLRDCPEDVAILRKPFTAEDLGAAIVNTQRAMLDCV